MANTPDKTIVTLMQGIKTHESGGNYQQKPETAGTSLGGAYMYQKPTWQQYAKDTVGDSNLPFTPENQDKVTYYKIKQWKDQGLNPEQIISKWNPGAGQQYVDKVKQAITGETSNKTTPQTFEDYLKTNPNINDTKPTGVQNLKADTGKGILGKTIGFLGDITGTTKLGEGLGYMYANDNGSTNGTQGGLIKANKEGIDIQGKLLKQVKDFKAKGKDTTKLEKTLKDLGISLESNANKVSDVGTGGITNKDVGLSALQTAGTVLTAPSLIKSGIGLLTRGGSALASEPVVAELSNYAKATQSTVGSLSAAEKVNAITEAVARAEPGVKPLLDKALQELAPQVLKEAGVGSFAELNPTTAKALGLTGKAIKFLARAGLDIAGLNAIKGFIK